jgi:hypothetical protein
MACPVLVSAATVSLADLTKPFPRDAEMLRYLATAGSAIFGNNSLRFRSLQTVAIFGYVISQDICCAVEHGCSLKSLPAREACSMRGFKTFDDRRVLRAPSERRMGVSPAGQSPQAMPQTGRLVAGLRLSFGDATDRETICGSVEIASIRSRRRCQTNGDF